MKFTLKNKTELINLNGSIPELVLPTYSGLGYLDIKVNELLKSIKNRNFKIPGIDIKFELIGIGPNKKIIIEEISGNGFRIILNNDGFQKIIIPKLMLQKVKISTLNIIDDILVILYKYSGKNWDSDKDNFYKDIIKNNSKKRGDKKTYVIYDTLFTNNNDKLIHNNYCNNEYDLDDTDKLFYNYKDIENEISIFLDFVIEYISYKKESKFNIDIFKQPIKVPLTNTLIKNKIYTFITEADYRRLHYLNSGIEDTMENSINYGLIPTLRLVPIGTDIPDNINEFVFDGFIWGEFADNEPKSPSLTNDVFKHDYISVELNLHNYANVFIVDKYVEKQTRAEIYEKYKSPLSITKEDNDLIEYSLASTLIHINDYKNNYKEPIVVIKRELHPDEILI